MLAPRPLSVTFALAAAVFSGVYAAEVQTQPPPPVANPANNAAQASDAAAAKHLRRTACLKDARARKLVGAQRAAYIKTCIESTASDS